MQNFMNCCEKNFSNDQEYLEHGKKFHSIRSRRKYCIICNTHIVNWTNHIRSFSHKLQVEKFNFNFSQEAENTFHWEENTFHSEENTFHSEENIFHLEENCFEENISNLEENTFRFEENNRSSEENISNLEENRPHLEEIDSSQFNPMFDRGVESPFSTHHSWRKFYNW